MPNGPGKHELATRREFLTNGLALVGVGATVPSFLVRAAHAMAGPGVEPRTTSQPGIPDDRILVVVQFAGGNDGLNTVVPFRADPYFKARPQLALKADDVLRLTDEMGLHPQAIGLKTLFDEGRLSIVHSVGYPNPNRSHFKSMDIWHTASPDGRRHEGWLGRYFDCECKGEDSPDPMQAIALMDESPLALRGGKFAPIAFEDPSDLSLRTVGRKGKAVGAIEELNRPEALDSRPHQTSTLDFLRRTAMDARLSAERIRGAAGAEDFGRRMAREGLGRSLRLVARMIAAGMPTRVYYVSLGGFDTHAAQLNRHARLMREAGEALTDFVKELSETGHLDRTLIMTFSEFGRRVSENASGGTDHGEAAPMFLIGSGVKPGLIGKPPDLSKLHRGDVPFNIDFRQVYAAVLRQWLGADPRLVLGPGFNPLPLIKTK